MQNTSSRATGGNVDADKKKIVKNKSLNNIHNKPAGSPIKEKCGYKHESRKCPAFGTHCHNCKNKKMHELQENDDNSDIFL